MKKRYIVTGGAGFVGSNLVDRLLQDGYEVLVLDNLSSGFLEHLSSECVFLNVDISDAEELARYDSFFKDVAGIFHLAAQSRIQPAITNPNLAHDNNVTGVYNILEMMRRCNIPKIVFAASSSVYGLKNECPQQEDMITDCLNPYSVSKYIGEQYIKTWCKLYGLEGACLRFFNVWGPREVIHLKDVAPIMGLFFRKLLQENVPLTIVGDGQQLRDHTHVSDVVEANVLAMQCEKRMEGEVFNIGTGKNYSVLQLADIILECLSLDDSYKKFIPARPGESRATKADNSKAQKWFGWEPKIILEDEIYNHRDYYLNKWKDQ